MNKIIAQRELNGINWTIRYLKEYNGSHCCDVALALYKAKERKVVLMQELIRIEKEEREQELKDVEWNIQTLERILHKYASTGPHTEMASDLSEAKKCKRVLLSQLAEEIKLRPVENETKEVSLSEIGKDWSLYVSADGFLSAIDKEHFTGWFWVADDKGRKFKMVNEKPLCTEICADPDLVEEETEKLTQETRNRERLRIANCPLKNKYKCKWDET